MNKNTDERESGDLLDHEYDGIKEYDNPLPGWWVWIFWGSFVFALGYFFHYHLSPRGEGVLASYSAEDREIKARAGAQAMAQAATEQSLGIVLADVTAVEAGKKVFVERCVLCHADRGQGNIGPNLTDSRWIHGQGKLMDIYAVVDTGVTTKGMPAWGKQLTPEQVRQVVAYVASIRNTNVPGKVAEGSEAPPP
jgi:cytochrome c oxidase cbb3-type subunit 3